MTLMQADRARRSFQPAKLGDTPFFNAERVETMLELLGPLDGSNRTSMPDKRFAFEWNNRVMAANAAYVPLGPLNPWDIPGTYDDPTGSSAILDMIQKDFFTAVDLAVRWRALGDTAAGAGCVNILTAWAINYTFAADAQKNDNGALVWSNRWPVLLQAAMMVRDHPAYTPTLDTALRNATLSGQHISMARRANNNTGTWGIVWEFAAATFLEDAARFNRAILRWQTNFNSAVEDNVPKEEIRRHSSTLLGDGKDGLWYSNFFLQALTIAAEWARFSGVWLYDHVSPNGSSFRGLVDKVRHWTRYPALYPYNWSENQTGTIRILPHDDILHALWPSDDSQWMLDTFTTGNDRDSTGMRGAVLAYRYRPLIG